MKYYLVLCCFVLLLVSCKKEKACPNLEGEWLLTEIWQDNLKTVILDTSVVSETLVIKLDNTFTSSSTKNGKIWNTGTFDCSKVFDADSSTFKKGSKLNYNLYVRQ